MPSHGNNHTKDKKESNINLEEMESISLPIDEQNSDLQETQRLDWRNDFSLSSLHSNNDYYHGYDSILVAKRRISRKQLPRSVETCHNMSFNKNLSYNHSQDSMQYTDYIQSEKGM
jgi:hypothetical protein